MTSIFIDTKGNSRRYIAIVFMCVVIGVLLAMFLIGTKTEMRHMLPHKFTTTTDVPET